MSIFVTFQFRPTPFAEQQGFKTEKYAVSTNTIDEAREIAADVYSLDGVSYLRINKCGKLTKGTKTITYHKTNDGDIVYDWC